MCRTCGRRHNSYDLDPDYGIPQDVDLESTAGSIPFSLSHRSPGKVAGVRGHNLKEYEDKLEHFKKENFALKLRIYFLEERMSSHKSAKEDKGNLHKTNLELKIETEALKKELYDKQELLRQASDFLSTLEGQYKERIRDIQGQCEREKEQLINRIEKLEEEMECKDRSPLPASDLTQLCDLAFSHGGDNDDETLSEAAVKISADNRKTQKSSAGVVPAVRGIFSLDDNPALDEEGASTVKEKCRNALCVHPQSEEETCLRMQELEGKVNELQGKVSNLKEELWQKERASTALEEDLSNLRKELVDQEEKMSDLETEVAEKDQKVDQLMQNLEIRRQEIQDKDSTIQTLHEDLNKVEPEIEVKIQELIERDRIIEEKREQLQQQNKILVEIQITLDEKQKQIAELEANILEAQSKVDRLTEASDAAAETIKALVENVLERDKEISQLKKDLKRKEKKIKDLTAELKESIDMLKKAKWEAETIGGEDTVKEMVEEENERLWAELEQKECSLKEANDKIELLHSKAVENEEKLKALLSQINDMDNKKYAEVNKDSTKMEIELAVLKERATDREQALKEQNGLIENLKRELKCAKEQLTEKRDEMKDLKNELCQKNADIQGFIKRELLGDPLQNKYSLLNLDKDKQMEALKLFITTTDLQANLKEMPSSKSSNQIQTRSNSMSQIKDSDKENKKESSDSQPGLKAGRSNSLSLLENALFANMGQKVYNTNQTFNTYVLPGGGEPKPSEVIPMNEAAINPYPKEINNCIKKSLAAAKRQDNLNIKNGSALPRKSAVVPPLEDANTKDSDVPDNAIATMRNETNRLRDEVKALRDERDNLQEKLSLWENEANHPEPDYYRKQTTKLKEELEKSKEKNMAKDQERDLKVLDYHKQLEALKDELKMTKKKITLQVFELASHKYQNSVNNYKQEIASLRQRLADSHNACDALRSRLEELSDFLEQILEMDKNGTLNLSHISSSKRASLRKILDDSRALSHSLSHSLMIGADSLLSDCTLDSRFSLPLNCLPEEIDVSVTQPANAIYQDYGQSNMPDENVLLDLSFDFNTDSSDTIYNKITTALNNQFDTKTEEIDNVSIRLNQLGDIIRQKDIAIRDKVDTIEKLQLQMKTLKEINYHSKVGSSSSFIKEKAELHGVAPTYKEQMNPISHQQQVASNSSSSSAIVTLPDKSDVRIESHSDSTVCSALSVEVAAKNAFLQRDSLPVSQKNSSTSDRSPSQHNAFYQTAVLEQPNASIFMLASPSESEAWSEPDRNVSLARIGLDACSLSAAHDRSMSRSRFNRSTPLSSESDVEVHLNDSRDISLIPVAQNSVISVNKPKRRSDAAEVKRLTAKLKNIEQLNETLRAELHIFQTLNQLNNPKQETRSTQVCKDVVSQSGQRYSDLSTEIAICENSSHSLAVSTPLLQEIRSLRNKLEEAITNNDLLRDQLEAALAGYLNEETKNLTSTLAAVQQELQLSKDQLLAATRTEQLLRNQYKETESTMYDLGLRMSECMANNEALNCDVSKYKEDFESAQKALYIKEGEIQSLRALHVEETERADETAVEIEKELSKLRCDLKSFRQRELEKDATIKQQAARLSELKKCHADGQLFSEKEKSIGRETMSTLKDINLQKLQEALQNSETKLLQVTKENLALHNSQSRLHAQLASANTHTKLLEKEINERSFDPATEMNYGELDKGQLLKHLKKSLLTIKDLETEKTHLIVDKEASKKEVRLIKEEALKLRDDFAKVASLEERTRERETQIASLLSSNKDLGQRLNEATEKLCSVLAENERLCKESREVQSVASLVKKLSFELDKEKKRCYTLEMEANNLRSKLQHLTHDAALDTTGNDVTSLVGVTGIELFRPINPRPSKNYSSDKENGDRFNRGSSAFKTFRMPSEEDEFPPSGESPDLGIGSDGQYSSLERKARRNSGKVFAPKDLNTKEIPLCRDANHNKLMLRIEDLERARNDLSEKLLCTQAELTKANRRKDSVEKAICRQLTKTQDVLKKTQCYNARHTKGQSLPKLK